MVNNLFLTLCQTITAESAIITETRANVPQNAFGGYMKRRHADERLQMPKRHIPNGIWSTTLSETITFLHKPCSISHENIDLLILPVFRIFAEGCGSMSIGVLQHAE